MPQRAAKLGRSSDGAGAPLGRGSQRSSQLAQRIRSGTVGVNGGVFYGADAPFGGYKASGFGRQNGVEGFEQYLETKTISGPTTPPE